MILLLHRIFSYCLMDESTSFVGYIMDESPFDILPFLSLSLKTLHKISE